MLLFAFLLNLVLFIQSRFAAPLVFVQNVTVLEGDSSLPRTIDVPINWSNAVHLRIRIAVTIRRRGKSINLVNAIRSTTSTMTLDGTGATTIPVRVSGDLDREPDEIADIRITFLGLVSGGDAGVLTIRDDDHPIVTVSESFALEGGSVDLPNGPLHIIRLSKAINQSTMLNVRTASSTALPGRDFNAVDQVVTILAHDTIAIINVELIDDNVIDLELVKEYFLEVVPVRIGDIAIGGNLTALGRITDDESANPQEAIFQLEEDPVPPNFLNGTVNNCRSNLPTDEPFNSSVDRRFKLTFAVGFANPFEVRFVSSSGGGPGQATEENDYDPIDEIRTLTPGRTAIFTIRVHDDGASEGDEELMIQAFSRIIRQARPCGFQNLLGAQSTIKINGNLF